jgi:hypothetical protein
MLPPPTSGQTVEVASWCSTANYSASHSVDRNFSRKTRVCLHREKTQYTFVNL